jgi:hypothetical protein
MFDPTNSSPCSSDCFTVVTGGQTWDPLNNLLVLTYTKMSASCISGSPITIRCPGFKNPIYKTVWTGFKINTLDGDSVPSSLIETSVNIGLNSTQFTPYVMNQAEDFLINPTSQIINTASLWSFAITMDFPLLQQCLVKIIFPDDLSFAVSSVEGLGFMMPASGGSILAPTDYSLDSSVEPRSITFNACRNPNMLSSSPAGQLMIANIQTPGQIMDTGNFFVEIYSGTQAIPSSLVAHTTVGVKIPAGMLQPGVI